MYMLNKILRNKSPVNQSTSTNSFANINSTVKFELKNFLKWDINPFIGTVRSYKSSIMTSNNLARVLHLSIQHLVDRSARSLKTRFNAIIVFGEMHSILFKSSYQSQPYK